MLSDKSVPQNVEAEHTAIFDAVMARDADCACGLIEAHIEKTAEAIPGNRTVRRRCNYSVGSVLPSPSPATRVPLPLSQAGEGENLPLYRLREREGPTARAVGG